MTPARKVEAQFQYNHFLRTLAFLAEQKVATAKQIDSYCFYDTSHSYIWKALKQLRQAKLIEEKSLKMGNRRRFFAFSLTKSGFQEMKELGQLDLEDLQLKSNSPLHDIVSSDLRLFFSRLEECRLFVPENIIRSKILEEEVPDLGIFRAHRNDAAVLMNINGEQNWFAVEYERSQKSQVRYENKIKNWYQAENLFCVLVVGENESVIQQMSKIELKILPDLPRKVLYLPLSKVLHPDVEVRLINCKNKSLLLKRSDSMKVHHPILNQNLENFRTSL